MSAWGAKSTLADKLRAQPAAAAASNTVTININSNSQWQPIQLAPISANYHYFHNHHDGSKHVPAAVQFNHNTTLIIALFITNTDNSGNSELLLVPDEDDAEKYYLPAASLQSNQTLSEAAQKLVQTEISDEAKVELLSLISIEHYPSLKNNWFRYTIQAKLINSSPSSENRKYRYFPLKSVAENQVALSNSDIIRAVESFTASKHSSLPRSIENIVFPYNTVDLIIRSASNSSTNNSFSVLLVKHNNLWQFPITYVDKGESIQFTAQRLLRALFGLVAEENGIVGCYSVTNSSPHQQFLTSHTNNTLYDGSNYSLLVSLPDCKVDSNFLPLFSEPAAISSLADNSIIANSATTANFKAKLEYFWVNSDNLHQLQAFISQKNTAANDEKFALPIKSTALEGLQAVLSQGNNVSTSALLQIDLTNVQSPQQS
jgi:ADP-ribose pyrophosphatase YjhB (NUDIX family)